jgi:hypothetical protein
VIPAGTPITNDNFRYIGTRRVAVTTINGALTDVTTEDITRPDYDASPSGPAWLRSLIGDDYFQTVYSLSVIGCDDNDLALISTHSEIQKLGIIEE